MAKKKDTTQDTENAQAETSALPLFYKEPIALDAKKHAALSLKKNFGFNFTEGVNAVPVNMVEMPQVCHFYPIAFSPDENATPVAIIGLRDNENLFLDAKGNWDSESYIPAYIRRYPFIFSEIPDTEQLTLCIDNVPEVVEKKGEQTFFDDEGKPSKLAENALEFCKSYHAAAQQTQNFSRALADAGVLMERAAQVNIAGNKRINFSGFRIIDEKKLSELDDKIILEWHKNGWMGFVYAHLFSGSQWQSLARRLNQRLEKEAA
ncbi:MAG: SapC family protein [Alphaproteobacteria bacterium]